jgi:dihydroxy-acid dehydratase
LGARRVDALVEDGEWDSRSPFAELSRDEVATDASAGMLRPSATPWQELYRSHVGQLHTGGCLDFACEYRHVCRTVPRHNH